MVVMRDPFLRELDKEESGLEGHMNHYDQILEFADPDIYDIIHTCDVPH
jgi:predicted glycosyltransferase